MDRDKYRSFLLKSIPNAKVASGGDEVICRCPYCGDSLKHRTSGHFYISIPKEDEPSQFDCKLCPASGWVSNKKLNDWGIYDIEMGVSITQYNNRIMKLPKNHRYNTSETVYNIKRSITTVNEFTEKKLRYINNRLGLDLSYQDMIDNKILLNLGDLLQENNITTLTRAAGVVQQLNDFFIGFISADNSYVNLRSLVKTGQGLLIPTIDKRYINYNIFGKVDTTRRFYVNPVNIDITSPEPINIHLGEGAFDVLSIKYNLRKDFNHSIYCSINGSGYFNLIKYFIKDLKLTYVVFHIYPDADISDDKMMYIAQVLQPFDIPIYIHRNVKPGEKDFGVPINRISEHVQRIL